MRRLIALWLVGSLLLNGQTQQIGPAIMIGPAAMGNPSGSINPTVVQVCASNNFSTSSTCTFGANITAGHTLWAITLTTAASFTNAESGCGTWANVSSSGAIAAFIISIDKAPIVATAACTMTSSIPGGSQYITQLVWEVSGGANADGQNYSNASFCTSCTGPSVTPGSSGDLILDAVSNVSGTPTYSAIAIGALTTTVDKNGLVGGAAYSIMAHATQATAAAVTMTYTTSAGQNYPQIELAIKP